MSFPRKRESHMKILVFSDSRLTDKFEEKKFKFLKKIISQADKVIINGDFWDGYRTTFERFINSQWKKLLPLLKSKNTIYAYGNHDKKIFSDKRTKLFSAIQTERYQLKIDNKLFTFEYGHRLCPFLDDKLRLERVPKFITALLGKIHELMVKKYGKKFLKIVFKRFNKTIKKKLNGILADNQIYCCGHTHWAEVDIKNKFANSGIIRHGLGQYLIINNGRIELKEEWYN